VKRTPRVRVTLVGIFSVWLAVNGGHSPSQGENDGGEDDGGEKNQSPG